jgi:hypothetical protein
LTRQGQRVFVLFSWERTVRSFLRTCRWPGRRKLAAGGNGKIGFTDRNTTHVWHGNRWTIGKWNSPLPASGADPRGKSRSSSRWSSFIRNIPASGASSKPTNKRGGACARPLRNAGGGRKKTYPGSMKGDECRAAFRVQSGIVGALCRCQGPSLWIAFCVATRQHLGESLIEWSWPLLTPCIPPGHGEILPTRAQPAWIWDY